MQSSSIVSLATVVPPHTIAQADLVVIGEIAVLPLMFGLWQMALAFSALNLLVLWFAFAPRTRR